MCSISKQSKQNKISEDIMSNESSPIVDGEDGGIIIIRQFGEREAVGTTATGEDIWRGNELTPAPTSTVEIPTPASVGEQMSVVSESVNDAEAGTGAQIVNIHYINATTGKREDESVTLNGTTPVPLADPKVRYVNDMHVLSVGSGGTSAGHIKIFKTDTVGLVYDMIYAGTNKSMVPNWMVPSDCDLILKGWHCEEAQGKRAAIRIRTTDMEGVISEGIFLFKDVAYLKQSASGMLELNDVIPPYSIVKVTAWAAITGAEVSCSWWGKLIPRH